MLLLFICVYLFLFWCLFEFFKLALIVVVVVVVVVVVICVYEHLSHSRVCLGGGRQALSGVHKALPNDVSSEKNVETQNIRRDNHRVARRVVQALYCQCGL